MKVLLVDARSDELLVDVCRVLSLRFWCLFDEDDPLTPGSGFMSDIVIDGVLVTITVVATSHIIVDE